MRTLNTQQNALNSGRSDPGPDIDGWDENDRGVSFTFGVDVIKSFLEREDLELIVRAHQVRAGRGVYVTWMIF